MKTDFRRALKEATQPDHELTDHVMSGFDLRAREGLAGFLAVHHTCFRAMIGAAATPGEACDEMAEMLQMIELDLTTLGANLPETPELSVRKVDPLALDYVFEGSRLGTKVLRRNWAASADRSSRSLRRPSIALAAAAALSPVPR